MLSQYLYYTTFYRLIQLLFCPSSITCVNSMDASYIPIAEARGFTTHWIKSSFCSTSMPLIFFPVFFSVPPYQIPLIFLLFYLKYLYVYFSVIFRFCLSFVFQLNLSVKTKIAKPCFGRTPQSLFPIYFMIHDGQHISFSGFRRIS